MPIEIKGVNPNEPEAALNDNGRIAIDQFDESTSGLSRDSISRSDFEEALQSSTRGSIGNESISYAYAKYEQLDTHPVNGAAGASSLMNEYALMHHPRCNDSNDFFDKEGSTGAYPKNSIVSSNGLGYGGRQVTIRSILEQFSPADNPSKPYNVSDFLYAKYYGRIPLNHLVTLRRFPFPTYDNLKFANGTEYKPLAQAVSFFGEPTGNSLKDLSKIGGYINWKEMEANVHDVEGNERGVGDTPFVPRGVGKLISLGGDNTDLSGRRQSEIDANKKYSDPSYTGRTLGPVNVVNKTHIRDRGLGATQEFKLVFEYSLRSIGDINPRIAMLDIICNMLALTFNNAKFWGGANRYHPKANQFGGLLGDDDAFYEGRYGDYIDSFIGEIGTSSSNGLDVFKSIVSNIFSGNFMDVFSSIAKGVGGTMLDLKAAKSRPQILGFKALLSGEPVGEHHITIGNPHQPILTIGNLICTGYEFELGEELGIDDFPTEMKWVVNLKYGRPRDKGDIESMFIDGGGRIYYPPPGKEDALNLSSSTETTLTPNTRTNENNPSKGTAKPREELVNANDTKPSDTGLTKGRGQWQSDYLKKLEGTVF